MNKEGNIIRIPIEESYNHQYAWDKQEKFMSAKSRAMGTLSNLIKQFVSLADEEDERRLKLADDGFVAELKAEGEDVWGKE